MGQTEIDWTERAEVLQAAREKTIDERFAEFHAANPEVYAEMRDLALKARRKGQQKLGVRMLWEVMRWNRLIRTSAAHECDFKLNDHYPSRYARMLMEQEPELAGLFELRDLKRSGGR